MCGYLTASGARCVRAKSGPLSATLEKRWEQFSRPEREQNLRGKLCGLYTSVVRDTKLEGGETLGLSVTYLPALHSVTAEPRVP